MSSIVPRFNLERAKQLLRQGRQPAEVIAAAMRLGDDPLKRSIELFIACGDCVPLKFLGARELGLVHRKRVERRVAATGEVLSNPDILACILRDNVGPSTFAVVSEVCRAWRDVCRSDPTVLRSVALYQGGLTRAKLLHLFAITQNAAKSLPYIAHTRYDGAIYYVYSAPAIDRLLCNSGMEAWRIRLQVRASSQVGLWPPPPRPPRRAHWQEEARLHAVNRAKLASRR